MVLSWFVFNSFWFFFRFCFVFGSFFRFWLVIGSLFGSFLVRFGSFLDLWFVFGSPLVRFWFVIGSFLSLFSFRVQVLRIVRKAIFQNCLYKHFVIKFCKMLKTNKNEIYNMLLILFNTMKTK